MGKTLGYGEITVANMTEPFTVMLTNEAQQFATDSNRKVTSAQSYYTDIIVIRGSQERTDYTIGNITSDSGITVSKTSKRVTFSVSAGSVIGADTGVIEIPITLDGQTVKKQFSWSCGKQGPQGVKGTDGNSFAWNMLSETNCGKKHWGTVSSGGKYSVESETTEDNIEAVKLICTESVSSSGWSYTCFTDLEMLKQLKPSTKYTLSYDIKANRSGMISHTICRGNITNSCTNTVVVSNIIGDETWQHISVVLTTNDLKTTPTNEVIYLGRTALSKVGYSIIKNLKLTEGYIDTPWSPSQSDIEGKGIAQIVQYYLATSQATGVTSSTSGWSTDITTQKITATKKYLWNCSQTKYTDGTSEPITTPTIIGVYGDKGETGANGQDGAGFHWNLLSGTKDFDKTKMSIAGATSFDSQKYLGLTVIKAVSPTGSGYVDPVAWNGVITPTPNTQYTISFYAKASVTTRIASFFYPNCTIKNISNYHTTTAPDGCVMTKLSTEWNRYSVTWTTSSSVSGAKSIIPIRLEHGNTTDGATVYLCGIKLEQSDKSSPWCTTYEETLAKNLTITPSSQYFKSTDGGKTFAPNTITIKPTIQGEINFGKWQYSIDGGVSFADVVSGQKGLTISNNVLTVSKDSSLYSDAVTMITFRAVASDSSFYDTCSIAKIYDVSDIGDGRNLLTGVSSYTKDTPFEKTDSRADGWIVYQNIITSIELEAGKKYVLQAKTDGNWAANHDTNGQDPSKKLVMLWLCSDTTNDFFDMRQGYVVFTPTVTAKYKLRVNQYSNGTDAYTIHLWDIKLEKGSSPTGWTPAPEDVQTAILSTKSEISDVSLKVDNNKQAIEQRVEKTTYEQDLTLVKGDISKANEGLNKWRYEIYPKSLFASEYQGKSTMDVFAKNTNLTPSQSVLINDTDLSIAWNYAENYIGYALTFTKFSAAKSVAITFAHDDGAHIYLNGKLIGGSDAYNNKGESLTLGFVKGWNCIEVVVNEGASTEGFKLGTTLSALSECQLMNCYYGTPVARQSHITNQLVQNTTDIDGVSTKVSKVTSVIGDNGENFTSFKNDYSDFKLAMDGFKTTVGKTYVTKDDFNGLEIGGRNLVLDSKPQKQGSSYAVVSRHLSVDLQAGVTYTISFCGRVVDGDGSLVVYLYRNDWKDSIQKSTKSKENTVISWQFTPKISGAFQIEAYSFLSQGVAGGNVYLDWFKVEKGNKATDWTPAPEDNEINGQNLVSNLPSNWEQGSINYTANLAYGSLKATLVSRLRTKDVFPVSGNIAISAGTSTNSSKEELNFYYVLFDINKKSISHGDTWQSLTSPKIINCGDAKYMAIILRWGSGSSAITPSDISKICLKIERGTSATPFTLAPEDINGKIQSVETIATQTADKFSWLVKSGTSSSNFELTDKTATLVASKINQYGLVTFNGLDDTTKDKINTTTGGNLITVTPANPKSDYGGGQTYNVTADDKGGRCVQWNSSCASFLLLNSYTPVNFTSSDQLYYDIRVPNWSSTTFDTKLTIWFYNKNKANITSASKTLTLKSTIWNHFTGYLTLPSSSNWGDLYYYIIGLTNPNKQAIGITNDSYIERVNSYATTYAKNAVDWVGQNGTNTNNMYSMISKWANGAVSANTKINGGLIETDSILAKSIAIGDFANYSQLNHATASHFGFTTTDDSGGEWFTVKNMARDIFLNDDFYDCKPGDTFRIEFSISTSMKGNSKAGGTDSNYVGSTIGLYSFSADLSQSSIYYAQRITASANATETAVSSIVTIGAANRLKFRVFLQTESYGNWSGTLKIRNVTVRKMTTGNLIVDGAITADKIATDAIKSRNYISSGGTQGSFLNLSDGSFTSPNLSWDSNGNLIAKNANLSGQITATKGTIGGWNIKDSLYSNVREPYDINKYYAKKILNKPSFTNIYMSTNVLSAANYGTVGGDHVTVGDSLIATNTAYSFGVNISLGRISLFGSTYYTSDLASELNKSSSLSLSGDKISFWEYDEDGHEISEQNNTYITSNYARFSGDIFIGGGIGTDGGADIGGKLQASSIAAKNGGLIETAGTIYGGGEIQCGGGQMRIIGGDYGILLRNDGSDFYILSTDSGNQWGYWNSKRPFRINLANGIPYFEYGIIIPNENYLLGNGYQMCRGTSWGGVCIGDDSKGLRFYGTSIWASHSISTSDENLKENFTTLDQYEDFYMNLNPIGFNYIGDYDGKKTHFGFGAHKTEDVLESEGYDSDKFAVVTHRPLVQEDIEKRFGKNIDVDIETEYGVSYTEFIALNTHMIQKTRKELEIVKQEKADLETRLQAIEAKLGL